MTRSAQRFTDSSDSRLRSENRATLRHATWTQRLNFPRRSEHFLQSYLHFHNRKIIRAQVHFQSHLSASITLQLEYTTEMHWRPQNTDTEKMARILLASSPTICHNFHMPGCRLSWPLEICRVPSSSSRPGCETWRELPGDHLVTTWCRGCMNNDVNDCECMDNGANDWLNECRNELGGDSMNESMNPPESHWTKERISKCTYHIHSYNTIYIYWSILIYIVEYCRVL